MRTTSCAARGRPLAALLFLLVAVTAYAGLGLGQSVVVDQSIAWSEQESTTGQVEEPRYADVTLRVSGRGPIDGYPVDCVLVVDTSATADLANAKAFALDLVDQFDGNDRIALVSYATTARTELPLTSDRARLKAAIGDLTTGGKSALGLAMQMARRQLLETGRDDAILVEILLSDGQSNAGLEPSVEGEVAADVGIHIVSVGIGNLINRTLLEGFAAETGGLFFVRPTVEALLEIERLFDVEIAATGVRVDKRLPVGLRFVSATPKPSEVNLLPDGTTSVLWRMAELRIGQEIAIGMTLEAVEDGAWSRADESLVTYADFRGVVGSVAMPLANWPPMARFAVQPEDPTTSDMIEFVDRSEDTNGDGDIVGWHWRFGDGNESFQQHPRHRYPEQGTYRVELTVIDDHGATSVPYSSEVTVGNTAPFASFTTQRVQPEEQPEDEAVMSDRPRVGVEITLDASGSYDLDDTIERYLWDFDADGTVDRTTESPDVEHTFDEPGEHRIILTVVDAEGAKASVEKSFDVLATVTAERMLQTGLPNDWTLPNGVVQVTLSLELNTLVHGMAITETVPAGWTFTPVENDGATLRQKGQTMEWLFLEKFEPDSGEAQREIRYTLTAPEAASEKVEATISGTLGSSSPRIRQTIGGEDRVTATSILPVPVVISRWDVESGIVDPYLGETIGFDQIQYAVSLWLSEGTVPFTGERTVPLATMQDLIAYWLTGHSVHDPLP